MISAQDEENLGIFDLEREEQTNRLETLPAAVNVVAKKQIIGVRGESSVLKQPQDVVVLAVNVTAS